jgi:hypothetical protein
VAKPLAVVPDLDLELDSLYSLPPSEFTSARNDLSRRLKQAGREEAAAEVKQLRKPTVPVWAVNQVARGHRDEVAALLQASEQLRAAQGSALGGGETSKLRQATAAQREALQALTHRAHELLTAAGQSTTSAIIERIASTLRAAALDPANRELLGRGRMGEELDPSGFDALAGMPMPGGSRARTPAAKRAKPASDQRHQERLRRLRDDARETEAAADEAERQAEEAERQAESAAAAATRARRTAERARAALEAVEQASD